MSATCKAHEADLQAALARVRELEAEVRSLRIGRGAAICSATRRASKEQGDRWYEAVSLHLTATKHAPPTAVSCKACEAEGGWCASCRPLAGLLTERHIADLASGNAPDHQQAGAAGTKPEGLAAVQPDPEGQPLRSNKWSTGAPR